LASLGLPAEVQCQYSLASEHITLGDKNGAAVSLETPEPIADEFFQRDLKKGVRGKFKHGHSVIMTLRLDYMWWIRFKTWSNTQLEEHGIVDEEQISKNRRHATKRKRAVRDASESEDEDFVKEVCFGYCQCRLSL
jgi:hypothetical protein